MLSLSNSWRPMVTLLVLVALSQGCSTGKPVPVEFAGPTNKDMVADFGEMLKAYAKETKKAPMKPADLERHGNMFIDADKGLRTKAIVYQWGQPISSDSKAATTILAYEKDAPSSGGWVLMQDGSLKQVTADEFKAAPKAGK